MTGSSTSTAWRSTTGGGCSALLPSLRNGTQGRWDDVRAFRTTEVSVRTSRRRPVNTDGELSTYTPAHFRIRVKAIQVFAPGLDGA